MRYFWHFLHPDGSLGGAYGSRNTRFYMPAGFEILAATMPEAAAVAHFMRQSLCQQHVVGLHAMDAQNVLPFLNNYCFAQSHVAALDAAALPALPYQGQGTAHFPASGHIILSRPRYHAVIALSKGGAFATFSKETAGNILIDEGVALAFTNGITASSQGLGVSKIILHDACELVVEAQFTAMNQMVMSPVKFMLFRMMSICCASVPPLAYAIKKFLVTVLVRRKKLCPARLRRRIAWNDAEISVEDEIVVARPDAIEAVWVGGRFSAVHMGSSRYFEWQELTQTSMPIALDVPEMEMFRETGKYANRRVWKAKEE